MVLLLVAVLLLVEAVEVALSELVGVLVRERGNYLSLFNLEIHLSIIRHLSIQMKIK